MRRPAPDKPGGPGETSIPSCSEELMSYSALFDFSWVRNIWVKIALSGMRNNTDSQQNLHPAQSERILALQECIACVV